MSSSSDNRSSLEELKRRNALPETQTGELSTQMESSPAQETIPTGEERQELLDILWTMGEVLGEQTVILEELSQHMISIPRWDQLQTISQEASAVRTLLEQEQKDMAAIRLLLEQERQRREQAGKKNGRRFSIRFPKISLPRPSPGWLFLPLSLAALWAAWYGLGVLWNALSPIFT